MNDNNNESHTTDNDMTLDFDDSSSYYSTTTESFQSFNSSESNSIDSNIEPSIPQKIKVSLAFPGGGIRSAAFGFGILESFSKVN
jgi:hypothetical protein